MKGIELCRSFYLEAVQPVLKDHFPNLKHAAALIGNGSEVLGFDTEMSQDHHWGPRVLLFVEEESKYLSESIRKTLSDHLPITFRNYSTNWSDPVESDSGNQFLVAVEKGPVNHRVEIFTWKDFINKQLSVDITTEKITLIDWLTFPEQRLRTISDGTIFNDEIHLSQKRQQFKYLPKQVWLYKLASQWNRIAQEEHLMGRAGIVEDEIGSSIIASRLVENIMYLCFLYHQVYAPYPKWFGTAFKLLPCSRDLTPLLIKVQTASSWQEREQYLSQAYEFMAQLHINMNVTPSANVPSKVSNFFGRPFKVIHGGEFVQAIKEQALKEFKDDKELVNLFEHPLIGSIDQWSDNTDMKEIPGDLRGKIKTLYQ